MSLDPKTARQERAAAAAAKPKPRLNPPFPFTAMAFPVSVFLADRDPKPSRIIDTPQPS